jgi:hypothetical protein
MNTSRRLRRRKGISISLRTWRWCVLLHLVYYVYDAKFVPQQSSIAGAIQRSREADKLAKRGGKDGKAQEDEKGVPLAPSAKDLKPWYSAKDINAEKEKDDDRRFVFLPCLWLLNMFTRIILDPGTTLINLARIPSHPLIVNWLPGIPLRTSSNHAFGILVLILLPAMRQWHLPHHHRNALVRQTRDKHACNASPRKDGAHSSSKNGGGARLRAA